MKGPPGVEEGERRPAQPRRRTPRLAKGARRTAEEGYERGEVGWPPLAWPGEGRERQSGGEAAEECGRHCRGSGKEEKGEQQQGA